MPFGRYFDSTYDTPAARAFRDAFVRNVASLAVRDVNLYTMNIPREFLMAESDPLDGELAFTYTIPFTRALNSNGGQEFEARIQSELDRVGSRLTPKEVITRAETQSCAGCHFLFGPIGESINFPRALGTFEHVSEKLVENGEAGPRFAILRRFLTSGAAPVHSN